MTKDDLYKAWHAVGADIAGLKFEDFLKHLPAKQQEPVAKIQVINGWWIDTPFSKTDHLANGIYNLYTTSKPQHKPLTEEQIEYIRIKQEFDQWSISENAFKYAARAIEAAHGIKE